MLSRLSDQDRQGVTALPFSDSIVYVDESGDHGLASIDGQYPVFVLAFCLFSKADYCSVIAPRVTEFKMREFGHDQVVLHEREIRKKLGPFRGLVDPAERNRFMESLAELVDDLPFVIIASVIQKDRLTARYKYPANPYALALAFGLERIAMHLRTSPQGGTTHMVFEARGKKEDAELELEFRRICDGRNMLQEQLPFDIVFADKTTNSSGLQLADLIARPIGLHVLNPDQPNRAYEVIQKKFRRSRSGKLTGWGLKCFP